MTTIGDILLILMVISVTSLAIWGTMLATSLLFPYKAARLALTLEKKPGTSLVLGFFLTVPAFLLILFLANLPNPAVKVFALLVAMLFLLLAAIGGSGQVRLLADRIKATYGELPMFGALTRAAALVILVFNIPVLGWFLMAPLSLMAGIGSLTLTVLKKTPAPTPEAPLS